MANTKVTTGVIKDDAVGADQLASNSVVTASIVDNAITTAKINNDAILTAKISNSAVTNAKLSANSVDSDQYVDGSIDTAHIADGQITSAKLDTNISVSGTLTVGSHLSLGDSDEIRVGASDDLKIYHDGSNSYIDDTGTGNLLVRAGNLQFQRADGTQIYLLANTGAEVAIYYAGAKKFETTSSGIDVTGTVTSDGLTVDGIINKNSNYNITQFFKTDGSTRLAYILFRDDSPNYFEYNDTDTQPLYFINNNKKVLGLESNSDISFYNTAGTSQALFFDASTERLGIGTTSPSNKLHVYNTASADVALLESTQVFSTLAFKSSTNASTVTVGIDGAGNASFENKLSSGNMTFVTNGTERMRINSSGNVGIGTTSPDDELDVEGSDPAIRLTDTSASGYARLFANNGSLLLQSDEGNSVNNSIIGFDVDGTERMRIDSSGNVGIGQTSPYNLSVFSSLSLGGTSGKGGLIQIKHTNDTARGYLYAQSDAITLESVDTNIIRFVTNAAERARLDTSGNLLVNTTNNSNSHKVCINGSLGVITSGNGNRNFEVFTVSNENWNVADTLMRCGRNGTTGRSINAGGTINASGADYAEYMKKADTCGTIAKGDVCGVDSTGKLTDVFADAISFVIKSTNPSYVGGDSWGDVDLGLTEEQTETERQKYDRIAFSGQVPVNITGSFNVGDYVYPQANGTDIECVAKSSPTFEEYQICVGKIWATEDDGRPLVAVKIG